MNKKRIILYALILFLAITLPNNAFADFDAFYMVDSPGSSTQVTTFDWDELPWIYIKLPYSSGAYYFEVNVLNSPTDDYYSLIVNDNVQEIWISLEDGYDGNKFEIAGTSTEVSWFGSPSMRELGDWNLDAVYIYSSNNKGSGSGSTNFTVTPEPVSSTLFLVGAATLGFRRFRKSRKG